MENKQIIEVNELLTLPVKRPKAVWVFGIGNIIVGCYFMVRMVISWSGAIANVLKAPPKMTWTAEITTLLIFVIGAGLVIWLIILGYGLLGMKRWARRGSVLYGWISVILIVITLGAVFVSSIMDLEKAPRILKASITIDNGLAMLHWIYMILLLIFMKTAKVREAFARE